MKAVIVSAFFLLFGVCVSAGKEFPKESAARKIFLRIKDDNLPKEYVEAVMKDPRMRFDRALIDTIRTLKRRRTGFGFMFDSVSVARGKSFLKGYAPLGGVSKKYGVPPEILTAMFRIECDLGLNAGTFCAPTTFYTLYVHFPKYRAFALREMRMFLRWCKKESIDPFSVRGSWMGALFLTQFMPSSLGFGVDGDGDGKVNLLSFTDALFSIGNYLKKAGYRRNPRKAVFQYNHNEAYVKAVFRYAELIKK